MDKRVKLECIEALKKEGPPIIIVAAVREAEAVANACKENGINVEAFCDTEKRKTFEKILWIGGYTYSKFTNKIS